MYHDFTYEDVLASSLRAQWALDDVLRADQELDFSCKFFPDSLAGTAVTPGLSDDEQRTLNQIIGYQYLSFFGAIEEFVLPFVLDHARPMLRDDDFRVRALLNFASEEAKHIHLFKRFREAFERGFPVKSPIVGDPGELGRKVLGHHPLAVALLILMVEWMTHSHYLGSVRHEGALDPLFSSLLKHHWMEEAQHAKLDTLMVDALVEGRSEREIQGAMTEFFQICEFLNDSLQTQAAMNIKTLERAIGRREPNRVELFTGMLRAARWTYLGSGLTHKKFRASVDAMSPRASARIAKVVERAPALQSAAL